MTLAKCFEVNSLRALAWRSGANASDLEIELWREGVVQAKKLQGPKGFPIFINDLHQRTLKLQTQAQKPKSKKKKSSKYKHGSDMRDLKHFESCFDSQPLDISGQAWA